jgi:hypothetical protein
MIPTCTLFDAPMRRRFALQDECLSIVGCLLCETFVLIQRSYVQVSRAKDYISYVLSQRVGPRVVVDATHYREDLSIVDVPEVCSLNVP